MTRLLQAIQFKVLGFTLGEKKRRAPRARTGKRAETCEVPSEEPRKRAGTTSWRTPPEQTPGPRSDTRHLITPPLRSPGPKEPEIRIEIRWCSSPCGVEGNEKADEQAKQAADEPDARGVEWQRYMDRCGRRSAPPCSLTHINRNCSEAKWTDASKWVMHGTTRQNKQQQIPA